MFSGIHFYFVPNKIGEVQFNLLKKRVKENGGIVQDSITLDTRRIISALANVKDVCEVMAPTLPPLLAQFHTTEWISKSLSWGKRCADDQYTIASPKVVAPLPEPDKPLDMTQPEPVASLQSSSSALDLNGELLRRSSSSKVKFGEHKFGDPGFGFKAKKSSKKRPRDAYESPTEESTATNKEAERDSFTRHLIRKKMKFSELDAVDVHSVAAPDPKTNLLLEYNLGDDSDLEITYVKSHNWSLLDEVASSSSTRLISKATAESSSETTLRPGSEENTGSLELPQAPDVMTEEQIWFTGEALPRMATDAVRVAESDDVKDPIFFDILKPVPEVTKKAIEDEMKYCGPLAYKLRAALLPGLQELHDDTPESAPQPRPVPAPRRTRKTIDDSDMDDSENEGALNTRFEDNIGHQAPGVLSPYWERQKDSLAFQKLPLNSPNAPPDQQQRVNHNKHLTEHIEKLEAICLGSGEKWRAYAYRKAANILKSLNYEIKSGEEASQLRGIGKSILEKIVEILATGKLRKIDALQNEDRIQILSLFMGIFGVGQCTANKWCALGYKTLADIEKHATLTYSQAVGLKFYDEIKQRIPRAEMNHICSAIQSVFHNIDAGFIVELCGSFRRGKPDCGDLDVIITHKRPSLLTNVLHSAVATLHAQGVLTHDFTTVYEGADKYMGLCIDPTVGIHRRIDMLTVPPQEWPFALLYFTGSGHFNRSMRFWAGKRGYSLSQHGLRVNYGNDSKGPYIAGIKSESEIFAALGLDYRPPSDREV